MELRITTSAGMVTLQPVGRMEGVQEEGRDPAPLCRARAVGCKWDLPRIVMEGVRRPSRKRVSLSILA